MSGLAYARRLDAFVCANKTYLIEGDKQTLFMNTSTAPLYVSDLDGTLLRSDGTLSPYSKNHLNQLISDGMLFSIATARSTVSIRQILRDVHLSLPVVNLNGALLSDLHSGYHHALHALAPEQGQRLCECVESLGHSPFVSVTDGQRDHIYYRDIYNEGMQWFVDDRKRNGDQRLTQTDDVRRALSNHVLALTVIAMNRGEIDALRDAVIAECADSVQVHVFPNGYSKLGDVWLTVYDARATKDRGIQLLAEYGGLSLNELTVFGDGYNDVEMFKMATHAIAVHGAVPAVTQLATERIGDAAKDSVVKYLQKVHGSLVY